MSKLLREIERCLEWERKREDVEIALGLETSDGRLAKACGFASLDCLMDFFTEVEFKGVSPRLAYENHGLGRRLKNVRSRT